MAMNQNLPFAKSTIKESPTSLELKAPKNEKDAHGKFCRGRK